MKTIIKQLDPIKEEILSVRALNCCKKIGVTNMFELRDFVNSNNLFNVRNCGQKTILELQEALNRFSFVEISEYNDTVKISKVIPASLEKIFSNIFNVCVQNCNVDVSELFLKDFPTIDVFYERIFSDYTVAFISNENFEISTVFDCWSLIIKILKDTYAAINIRKFHDYLEKQIIKRIESCIDSITRQIDEAKNSFLLSRMSKSHLDVLQQKFINIKESLSVRSQNVLDRGVLNFKNIYPFCSKGIDNFINIRYCGTKTADEIISAYSSFSKYMFELACNPDVYKNSVVSSAFPFVDQNATDNIYSFYEDNGYYPFFKLMSLYYTESKNRNDIIWDKASGLTQPMTSFSDIAEEFGLTRERIRQLVSRYEPNGDVTKIIHCLNSENYLFLKEDFIDPTLLYNEIFANEFSTNDYFTVDSLVAMLSFHKNLKSLECGETTILINSDIYEAFDFSLSLADITKTISAKITEDVILPINIFITNYILNRALDSDKIKTIMVYILKTIMSVELDNDNNLILRQNSIDVEDEFYNIIEANGSPVLFDDLCTLLRKRYPEMTYATGTLRAFLFNSERISSIGKSSLYTLNKWNISRSTIRGLIREALEQSEKPLSLDAIVDYLSLKGRNTSKNSVNSTILSDEKCNYVKFKGGFIGLSSKSYDSYFVIENVSIIRKTFEERIIDYLYFIDSNRHVPFSSSDENEASLYRWYRNVVTGVLDITPEQKNRLEIEMSKRQQYIMTASEFAFIEKCEDFKYYVSTKFELPNIKSNSSLYSWFSKARQNIAELEGRKSSAWDNLVSFLRDYGFFID